MLPLSHTASRLVKVSWLRKINIKQSAPAERELVGANTRSWEKVHKHPCSKQSAFANSWRCTQCWASHPQQGGSSFLSTISPFSCIQHTGDVADSNYKLTCSASSPSAPPSHIYLQITAEGSHRSQAANTAPSRFPSRQPSGGGA